MGSLSRVTGKKWAAAIVLVAALGSVAHADDRHRKGTRIAKIGLGATLTGIAMGAFAIGLGNDRPDAAKPFFAGSAVLLGSGVGLLAGGFYLRGTSEADPDPLANDPVRARHRAERRAGVALIGIGGVVLITGVLHGIGAYYDNHLASDRCAPDGTCAPGGERLRSRSHTMALAADMLIGTGAIGVAGGVILYRGGRDTGPQLSPMIGSDQVGATVGGRF